MNDKNKKLVAYRDLLLKDIKIIMSTNSYGLYLKFKDFYSVSKKLNPKYTKMDMARELDVAEQKIYTYTLFDKANGRTLALVKDNQISFYKVIRYFKCFGLEAEKFQDKNIKLIIDEKMTCPEVEKMFSKKHQVEPELALVKSREYKSNWNITRDINLYVQKLQRSLLAINKVPANRKEEVIKNLKILKKQLDKTIKEMN